MNAFIDWLGIVPATEPAHGMGFHTWLYTLSNLAIGLAFLAMAGAEIYLVSKRKDLSYKLLFLLFIFLMVFFGLAFLLDSLLFWLPVYHFISYFKFVTALIAWSIFFVFVKTIPQMLHMQSQNQLKDRIEERTLELNSTYKKLLESEHQFRVLVNHHPDYISQVDKNFRYIFVNKAILELTGKAEDFFTGRGIGELGFSEDFVKEQEHHLRNAFEKGIYANIEITPKKSKGQRRFNISFIPVWDKEEKKVESVLNIARDITDQKLFENELNDNIHELQELSGNLATKNRQLQDFAHIVSHNLRSPMSNMVALINLYESEQSADQKEFLVKKIGEVTRSFSKTIDELTEVVKIRQQINLEFQHHSFEEVIEDIKTMLNCQISEAGATILCDFEECTTIRYPKVYLESVLLNLITNAIKYRSTKRALTIRLSSRIADGSVLLTCEDNGLGIDLKKYGEKIFGMNKTFHPNPDSRGMGLFITRNQLESLGGSISVESEPEEGTVFTVLFN